ncbi:TRIM2 [Branchiostoma lanceolatum]|uniref:TRIM2 protein n=1 Tax=Branchiostoma lanceolatum TaxID=7740 RepID=A0A8K0EFD7_BRALA|nr:TRIM2 [Branchiostoma lanceolatum]
MDPIKADDSDCGTGSVNSTNMQAAQADLPHPDSTTEPEVQHEIQPQRRSDRTSLEGQTDISAGHMEHPLQANLPHPDSTTEPEVRHEIQPQRRSDRASLEEQTDISPGDVEHPLQDVHGDASLQHSDRDNEPGFSPDTGADRLSVPTICTTYMHTTVGETEQNQALYVDNPLVEAKEPPSKDIYGAEFRTAAENAVQYQMRDACRKEALSAFYQCGKDVDGASMDRPDVEVCGANSEAEHCETQTETGVKRLKNVENSSQNRSESEAMSDDECIRPYAVCHLHRLQHTRTGDDQGDGQPYAVAYEEDEGQNENQNVDSLQRNCGQPSTSSEMRGHGSSCDTAVDDKDLQPNPMYAPNVAQPKDGGGQRNVCVITTCVVVVGVILFVGLFVGTLIPGKQGSSTPTTWPDPTFTGKTTPQTDGSRHADYTSPQPTGTQGGESEEIEQTKIVFGLDGHEAGDCSGQVGVVVSPGNEIFVGDALNMRVQVFSMKGVYLRSFPTITSDSECERVLPEGIFIDEKGHIWVEGIRQSVGTAGQVAVGRENLFVADQSTVHVFAYNKNAGQYLFSFGDGEIVTEITGMCTDSSDNVLVADGSGGNVELFTKDGQYVRRAASGLYRADSVAVAPGGQLVVGNDESGMITIFSHY